MKHRSSACELCGFRFRIARVGERGGRKRSWSRYVDDRSWCAWCCERVGDPAQLELAVDVHVGEVCSMPLHLIPGVCAPPGFSWRPAPRPVEQLELRLSAPAEGGLDVAGTDSEQ